jgi:tRNA-dihydrouridine synthase
MATGEVLEAPGMQERIAVAREHFEKGVEWKGERLGIVEMRRHYANYFKGLRDFKSHRLDLVTLDDVDAIRDKLDALATMPFEKAI